MANPLINIIPILDLLGRQIKILPATGGAVEELQHPDQDEIEDVILNKEFRVITDFAEVPRPDISNIYRPTPPIYRQEKHLFKFFIDGSIRTYFLGTGIEGRRSFPIELAQVGAAVVQRNENGKIKVHARDRKILFLIPKQNQGVSDTVWEQLLRIERPDFFKIIDFSLPDRLTNTKGDPRDKAGAKARSEMHKLEINLIKSTDNFRNENSWLILDGSVKFIEKDIWDYWRETKNINLIGVAKSFRKDPVFQFGRRASQRKDITTILAGLPHAHRTAAFSSDEGQIAFWYVRLREQKELDYPLMGVVKVEIPCPDKELIDSELIDLVSRSLIGERNVTPYGLDRRWHCSLYPIYIAEQVIKNIFFTREVLMGCIKWPRPQLEV